VALRGRAFRVAGVLAPAVAGERVVLRIDGARGPLVRLLQRGLARLHYAVPRSGVYDAGTGRAVMAFRKVTGLPRGYAIHGYVDVPPFNASHGCLRVPIPDACAPLRLAAPGRPGHRVSLRP
jgi:peptidoglycan hydrolase-like protein with peptidoglycan-binding domain